jgi:hypothetical protein
MPAKRSPRYPRVSLAKCLEMTKKLFQGTHRSKVDVDTAAKVIGYASSSGGAAASSLGALRQYGLVDGLRGDVAVSELAMRILEPMNDEERVDAIRQAAMEPEIFSRVMNQFNGKLPLSDEPVRAFLIRQEGFSGSGADELIGVLRETLSALPDVVALNTVEGRVEEAGEHHSETKLATYTDLPSSSSPVEAKREEGELIRLPLGAGSRAEVRFVGAVSATSYARLIRHLELLREMLVEEE